MPPGDPLRCKAQGGWGGSAHWPDPTAQSAQSSGPASAPRPTAPQAPQHRDSVALAGRQTPPRHPRGPSTATLRVALAGRQTLPRRASGTDVPSALLSRVCHPRECSLRFDRHARHVRETGAFGPCIATVRSQWIQRCRVAPKGPVRTGRVSPPFGSDAAHPICPAIGTIALHRTAQQPCARDDVPMTSSDGAPKSHHPATLFPVHWDALSMPLKERHERIPMNLLRGARG